jgi:biopolymer transport protein TolR
MAMSVGGSGGDMAQINVTPMIDILLVLLIIFMLIAPVIPSGLAAALPQPPCANAPASPGNPIVLEIASHAGAAPTYTINGADVAKAAILPRLREIFADRAERVLFVKGDKDVLFADVAELIDMGKAADADRVGLLTPGSQPGK